VVACGALAIACAGPSAAPADPSLIVVPPQPPQPTPPSPVAAPVVPVVATPSFRCTSGKRFEAGGRSYCAHAEPASWESAERRCVVNGGHLMSLDTEATSSAVRKALWSPVGGDRAAWIGLQLVGKGAQGKWRWINGDDLTAASWNTGEPNNWDGNEACAEWLVTDGRWNDTRCALQQAYLCQSKSDKLGCRNGRSFAAGGLSYCLHSGDHTWNEAKRACTTDGGSLAVLRTTEENVAVRDAMAARFSATRVWIGLTDAAEEGNWSWISGAPLDFAAWHPGEPNDFNRENCGQLYSDSWTWNDLDCAVELPSVCESPATRR
jgi:hypothetical protein